MYDLMFGWRSTLSTDCRRLSFIGTCLGLQWRHVGHFFVGADISMGQKPGRIDRCVLLPDSPVVIDQAWHMAQTLVVPPYPFYPLKCLWFLFRLTLDLIRTHHFLL